MPTYECENCLVRWSLPLEMDEGVVRHLVRVSKSRRLEAETVKALSNAFDLNQLSAMALIKHSLPRDHCVHCAAPLSDVHRFTRHCIACKGTNFDWRAAKRQDG